MKWIISAVLLLPVIASTFEPRCGDCWCVPGNDGTDPCPAFEGVYQSFDESWPDIYSSFVLTSSPLELVAQDGTSSTCFPFTGAVDEVVKYPESTAPACKKFGGSTTSVCAYKSQDLTSCRGREYELVTFDTLDEAQEADGVKVIHSGPCGVCSNAIDFAVRMKTIDDLQSQSISCTFPYYFDRTFDNVVACYQKLGFTKPCATLWAHFSVTNLEQCQSVCAPVGGKITMNQDLPPTCPFTDCIPCSSQFTMAFNQLAGVYRSAYNAGFNDYIAFPCSMFTRIENLDPCEGFDGGSAPPSTPKPSEPVKENGGSDGARREAAAVALPMLAFAFMFL